MNRPPEPSSFTNISEAARQAILKAQQAYRQGDHHAARQWAQQAAELAPGWEEPWLWLGATAAPHASINYLKRALEINPGSQRARKGMHWAVQRQRKNPAPSFPARQQLATAAGGAAAIRLAPVQPVPMLATSQPVQNQERAKALQPWMMAALLLVALVVLTWAATPLIANAMRNWSGSFSSAPVKATQALAWMAPTLAATATSLPSPTSSPTPVPPPTETPTPLPTATLLPTETPAPTDTPEPPPTEVPTDVPTDVPVYEDDGVELPEGVGYDERWIDVNLSEQVSYAYEGTRLINSFVVSTGTWEHPTVTGTYRVYVMYRYADMAGPGYYLPDVPYVMYFYQGYGLHGTYWHNNFGTPMSHGCVNFSIPDAGWVFDFVTLGTVVNVHY